jgi:ribosomal protein L21E
MLGREVNTPACLMFPLNPNREGPKNPEDFVADLVCTMQEAHNTARKTLKTSMKRMKRNYDLRLMTRQFECGDVVHLLDTASIKGKCKKLSSPWKGPGIIVKKFSSYIYRVKLKNAVFVTNHDRLKPCRDRNLPIWIKRWKERADSEGEDVEDDDDRLYCVCRKPCGGRFMILCDFCDEWFHGSCVNVTPTEALEIEKFKCRRCVGVKRADS